MTKKIFRSTIFVAAVVLLCTLGIILGVLYNYFHTVQQEQLRDELRLAAAGTALQDRVYLEALDAQDYRLTWIAGDGSVLFDTSADAAAMANHADREEFQEALASGTGSSQRYSDTLLERTVYEAMLLEDGSVLRISRNEQTLLILLVGMLPAMILVAAIAILLSLILAHRMSRRIVGPLNALDLEHPLQNEAYEEITPLLQRINRQNLQIEGQMDTLRRKADEFQQITDSMQEGLVLLDSEGTVLSINPTAQRLFSPGENCVGKNFLLVYRSAALRAAVNDALDRGHGMAREHREGRDYQIDLSRIQSDGAVIGVVVLVFDITERLRAENLRREFSANVSHELKTPLQSIMGSAELLENGMVKPEDISRFTGYIRRESARLLDLIQDIIRLSQLDEGASLPMEPVDLLALAEEVQDALEASAREKAVSVTLSGSHTVITGVRQLLYEVLYNLWDNAIRYNVPGGEVRIQVEDRALTVTDTGIGIPQEHAERVFERFYRVDKSHSRATGGTGLGLSIVKHAVQLHGGTVALQSQPGEGTTVKVQF